VARLKRVGWAALPILLLASGLLYGWGQKRKLLAEQKQQQMGRNVARGNSLVNEGNYFGAIPFFCEALRSESGVALSEENQRLRIGSVLEQCPKIVKMWVLQQHLNGAALSRDGRYVLTAGKEGSAAFCDLAQGSTDETWLAGTEEIEGVS